jgi:hypothetical protein
MPRISKKRRPEIAAMAALAEPVFPTWDAALEAVKADGATMVVEYNPGRGFTYYRPSKSVPGSWGTAVLFKLPDGDARGTWQRGCWLFAYDGLDPRALPIPFARTLPEGATL